MFGPTKRGMRHSGRILRSLFEQGFSRASLELRSGNAPSFSYSAFKKEGEKKRKTKMGVASLVLGIVGLVLSFIPCVGWIALALTIPGTILGACGILSAKKKEGKGKGQAIAGFILGRLATIIAIAWISLFAKGASAIGDVVDAAAKDAKQRASSQTGYKSKSYQSKPLTKEDKERAKNMMPEGLRNFVDKAEKLEETKNQMEAIKNEIDGISDKNAEGLGNLMKRMENTSADISKNGGVEAAVDRAATKMMNDAMENKINEMNQAMDALKSLGF